MNGYVRSDTGFVVGSGISGNSDLPRFAKGDLPRFDKGATLLWQMLETVLSSPKEELHYIGLLITVSLLEFQFNFKGGNALY